MPAARFQLLLYPVTDAGMTGTIYETTAPTMPLTAATMRHDVGQDLPDPRNRDDWRAAGPGRDLRP